jgi:hypothetical protein
MTPQEFYFLRLNLATALLKQSLGDVFHHDGLHPEVFSILLN